MTNEIRAREPHHDFQRLPFTDIVPALSHYFENRTTMPYIEYKVDGLITAHQLRSSLSLPFELAFTEDAGEVVVSPASLASNILDPNNRYQDYENRYLTSRLNAHTHIRRTDDLVVDTLSLQDLRHVHDVNDTTAVMLVHENGISQFRRPIYKLDGTPVNEELQPATVDQAFGIWSSYWDEKDFNPLFMHWGLQKIDTDKQTALAQEFVRRTGMVVNTAGWDEPGIDALVAKLNLRSS
jgi:hypothetical protein